MSVKLLTQTNRAIVAPAGQARSREGKGRIPLTRMVHALSKAQLPTPVEKNFPQITQFSPFPAAVVCLKVDSPKEWTQQVQ